MKPDLRSKDKGIYAVFMAAAALFVLVFFLAYRPMVVDNMDDWTYLSFSRRAVPLWGYWNPTRVFPEIFLPACAQLGVWLIYPFSGDYVQSVSLVLNLALCVFVLLYMAGFTRTLARKMRLGAPLTAVLSALFLVLHFKSWMSPWIPGRHVFYTWCVTTAFYYTIPALLNIMLVLYLDEPGMRQEDESGRLVKRGFLMIAVYLAVFSNLYSSCILAVYAGWRMLRSLAQALIRKMPVSKAIRENGLFLGVIAAWLVSMVYEVSGGRAGNLRSGVSLLDRFKETVHILLNTVEQMDDTVFYLCAGLCAVGALLLILSKCKAEEDRAYAYALIGHLFCAGVTLVFLVLLSAATYPEYIDRMDVLIGVVFYAMAAAVYSLAYIIRKWKHAALAVPLVTFILAFDVLIGIESFAHSTTYGLPAQTCLAVNQAFMEQILEAEQAGQSEITIKVPMYDTADNFPYAYAMGGRMIQTLKNHGIIERISVIEIEPDETFYEAFGIQ